MRSSHQNTRRWLYDATGGKQIYIWLLILLQSLLGISAVGYAVFFRGIVDSAAAGSMDGLVRHAVMMTVLVLAQLAVRCFYRHLEEHTRASLENALKGKLFSTLLTRDYAAVTAVHSGEWMNRLTSDTTVVSNCIAQTVPGLAGLAMRMASALVALLALDLRFGLVIMLGGGMICVLALVLRQRLKQTHSTAQEADGALRVFLSERLGSLTVIRAFGKEAAAQEQAERYMSDHKESLMKKALLSNLSSTALNTAFHGAYVLGSVYCGLQILGGQMSYGTFTAVIQLIGQTQAQISGISGFLPKYFAMLSSAERLMEAEAFKPEQTEPEVSDTQAFYRDRFRGIALRNVDFSYPSGPRVLEHFDLELLKNEFVAFTGPSGCGKSTVLRLLLALYPAESGSCAILSDSEDVLLTARWRSLFAYVPQGNHLMNGTIRQVVTFGEENGTQQDAQIRHALRIACADEFVSQLKDGLDTQLGERGAGLSEGQMQRIAIARAVFSQRPILLLDEATSALDEQTEKQLLQNLRSMTDKTVLIVSHRPAALEVTDRVVEFSKEPLDHA